MIINQNNLRSLFVAYRAAFQGGLGMAASQWQQIATEVPSATGAEEYGWLGQVPNMREWIGDRVVHGISQSGYTIKNKPFELTVEVPRAAIEDDQYGVYTPLFSEMGRATQAHPDQLVFELLAAGRATACYDGANFFSAAHPVLNKAGKPANQSNIDDDGGNGAKWYVLDTSRVIKPIIYQNRKAPNFVAKDRETDDNVFDRAAYKYGVDARRNVGYGFWQMAQSSNKTLNRDNLWNAITTLTGRKGDYERPLGMMANTLVVPASLEKQATSLINSEMIADGTAFGSNELKGRLKLVIAPWL